MSGSGAGQAVQRLSVGATLMLDFALADDAGGAVPISAGMLTLVINDTIGNQIAALPVTPGSAVGAGSISAPTDAFPVGNLPCAILIQQNGTTVWSDTFFLLMQRAP